MSHAEISGGHRPGIVAAEAAKDVTETQQRKDTINRAIFDHYAYLAMSPASATMLPQLVEQGLVTERSPVAAEATVPLPSYATFTTMQCVLIICLAPFAATFPAIDDVSHALHVSVGRINLTITSYMIMAGIAPAVLGDLADNIRRRMIYLFIMGIYCVSSIGSALQRNWSALFLLRMLQSAASAAK
ncbi:MFS efflux transporter, putative [Metarhizium acridum CQMa 102]|uniref:MFS efflux transporter, putative n=1 Tax=Metarhizium acridum (strain CQMa 102) TaxID=655827 RepID=E9DWX9_METAQ|nr:MFS efflux transporter, putative [Metarhizium acridum CQMa 102]EFY91842.1 MFS efflux transporter, putative [Metarhizium acridum CQMa 102]